MFYVFGSKNDKDSVPYLTVFTLVLSRLLFLRKLYLQWEGTNTPFNMAGEYPCKTCVANFCCKCPYISMTCCNRVIFIQ